MPDLSDQSHRRGVGAPVAVLAAFLLVLAVLLALPIVVPIGPMYWDTYIYFDAANRIADGQVPLVDFFTPVGPLGYYLVYWLNAVFPSSQPLLLAQWSVLLVAAPAMAIVVWDVGLRSQGLAFGLLVPFLLFTALPFDVVDFFPYPGVDGFGIYNRHGAELLYVLAAAALFVKGRGRLYAVFSIVTLALFLTKITAFIAGGIILAFAFCAGRIALRVVVATAATFLVALGILQLWSGITEAYLRDVFTLATMNSGTILPRFLTVASQRLDVVLSGGLLCLALFVFDWRSSRFIRERAGPGLPWWRSVAANLDRDWMWIGILMFAGAFFETQNTGSQAFIMVWPGVLALIAGRAAWRNMGWHDRGWSPRAQAIVLILVACTVVPTTTKIVHKALRAVAVSPTYARVEGDNLGRFSMVSTEPRFLQASRRKHRLYAETKDAMAKFADAGELPSYVLYSEPDFQVLWLRTVDQAVSAIRAREKKLGTRYETIFMLDFTNPFPFLMNRSAPKHVAIGADPFRAVPAMTEAARTSIENTDLVLVPTCPILDNRRALIAVYADALKDRRRETLTPCFDIYAKIRTPASAASPVAINENAGPALRPALN